MSSLPSQLAVVHVAAPSPALVPDGMAEPAVTSAPAANAEIAPIAALDALALCAASSALGG